MADLDQHLRATRIVAVALIISLLIYVCLVELIKQQFAPFGGFVQVPQREVLRWAFLAVALVEASLIRFLRGALLAPRAGAGAPGPRLQTASIVTLALCESVGVFGVVLFVISGSAADFYLFLALPLGLFAIYFPRHDRWEEWARQMAPRT